MPAFHRVALRDFIRSSASELTGKLSIAYANGGFEQQRTDQTIAWAQDLSRLRQALFDLESVRPEASSWTVLLEFEIPRKMKRIDAVLLADDTILLLEMKSHSATVSDCMQAEEYALLLHYFHAPSDRRRIVPLVVSPVPFKAPTMRQQELAFVETAAYWIVPPARLGWTNLSSHLASIPTSTERPIDPDSWNAGEYRPVPTIIEAALSLQAGLGIGEIAHSRAAQHDVAGLTGFVQQKIQEAQNHGLHIALFITGVPGSGKTLVGLNLAFSTQMKLDAIHFMSGNGPLVKVLQTVLARFQQSRGLRALDAKHHAQTLVENVHVFARTYSDDPHERAPSNHVVLFDEAQRAWDREQNFAKFKRNYSEPEMLLKIMERHADWAVVVALVGGGQEINTGEAGLEEWGRSLATSAKPWTIYASPEALAGGTSVAGSRLVATDAQPLTVNAEPALHLRVPVRSIKSDTFAEWVNYVVDGKSANAAAVQLDFPVLLTRDLPHLRNLLKENTLGSSRAGLVASSQAARLRAEGLEPDSAFHAGYPWEHWYLAPSTDVRSSFQAEVFATEFEIQGLELDWVGLCWGGDFVWSSAEATWRIRRFNAGSGKWSKVKKESRRRYRQNAYRVLLTRARQGLGIYIPRGDPADPTRSPAEFDETAAFLLACGARAVKNLHV